MNYTESYSSIVEPFDSCLQRNEDISSLREEMSIAIINGETIDCDKSLLPDKCDLSLKFAVSICVWCGLEVELQQYFDGNLSKLELCELIADQFATEIYDSQKQ